VYPKEFYPNIKIMKKKWKESMGQGRGGDKEGEQPSRARVGKKRELNRKGRVTTVKEKD